MIFLIDLEIIQHMLSSDYSLKIYFSHRFPYIDGPSLELRTNPYKMSIFKSCSFFFRNCTHILTRIKGKKFENMFLVKITNKGTSLRSRITVWQIFRSTYMKYLPN